MITLTLNKDEYTELIAIAGTAHWFMNSTRDKPDPAMKAAHDLIQKINKTGLEAGLDQILAKSASPKGIFTTEEFDEQNKVSDALEDYVEDCFWEDLARRLGNRDVIATHEQSELEAMTPDAGADLVYSLVDLYSDEFETHGISRMVIPGVTDDQVMAKVRDGIELDNEAGDPAPAN